MSELDRKAELLRELVACRQFLYSQLADLAEDQFDPWEAKAWRWLRDHSKWPVEKRQRKRRKKVKIVLGYGWTVYPGPLVTAERRGASILPGDIRDSSVVANLSQVFKDEISALLAASRLLANYMRAHGNEQ